MDKPTKEQFIKDYNKLSLRKMRSKYRTHDSAIVKWLNEYHIRRKLYYQRRQYPIISDFQKQFILGSLLGDMSIVRKGPQYRLSITHNHSQFDYIKYKQNILADLSLTNIQNVISAEHESKICVRGQWVNHIIKRT
jgi:hypothetical protein